MPDAKTPALRRAVRFLEHLRSLEELRFLEKLNPSTILAIACAVRVVWIALCPNEPISDQTVYYGTAVRLSEGAGYVDEGGRAFNYWPVGYPAILAPAFAVFGTSYLVAYVLNLVLGLTLVWGLYDLARLLAGRRAAAVAAMLGALHPTLVLYTTCIASENAFMPGMVWMVLCFVRAAGVGQADPAGKAWIGWALLAGVIAGATLQVRGTALLAFGALPLALLLWCRSWSRAVLTGVLFTGVLLLVTAPWSLRNQREFGRYSPLSFNGNANLWMGNHEGSTGGYVELPKEVENMGLLEREDYLGKEARRFWREHPGSIPLLAVRRTLDTLKSDTIGVVWNEVGIERRFGQWAMLPLRLLTTATHWLLLLVSLAIFGRVLGAAYDALRAAAQTRRVSAIGRFASGRAAELMLFATLGVLAFPFVFMVSGNRYHIPMIPFMLVLVALALSPVRSGSVGEEA